MPVSTQHWNSTVTMAVSRGRVGEWWFGNVCSVFLGGIGKLFSLRTFCSPPNDTCEMLILSPELRTVDKCISVYHVFLPWVFYHRRIKQNTANILLDGDDATGMSQRPFLLFLNFYIYFMHVCFLACMSVHHELAVPVVARRWHQIP